MDDEIIIPAKKIIVIGNIKLSLSLKPKKSTKNLIKDDSHALFGLVKTNKNGKADTTEKISDNPLKIIVKITKIKSLFLLGLRKLYIKEKFLIILVRF